MAAGVDHALLREYAFSDEDFQQIRRLVKERIGIHLAAGKRELVYGRISRRLRALGLSGFGEYLQRLEQGDVEELQQFCNAITTNLTAFFREAHHFRFLARERGVTLKLLGSTEFLTGAAAALGLREELAANVELSS